MERFDKQWQSWFGSGPFQISCDQLKIDAFNGRIDNFPQLRSLFWRLFLGSLSTSHSERWAIEAHDIRVGYDVLKQRYLSREIHESSNVHKTAETSLSLGDPLNSVIADIEHVVLDQELRRLIVQDVERTFPDFDFFRRADTQDKLSNILYIYCKQNDDISYRQGMHEILAPILFVFSQSHTNIDNYQGVTDTNILKLIDIEYLEHDCYAAFENLMVALKGMFVHKHSEDIFHSQYEAPIIQRCVLVQRLMLKVVDPALYGQLESVEIEPQLYGIRWFRLLFGREFEFDKIPLLWDILFADFDTDKLNITEWVALALLEAQREKMIDAEYTAVLQTLMKYPSEFDPLIIGKSAFKLRQEYKSMIAAEMSMFLSTASVTSSPVKDSFSFKKAKERSESPISSSISLPKWVKSTHKSILKDIRKSFDPTIIASFFPGSEDECKTVESSQAKISTVILNRLEKQINAMNDIKSLVDETSCTFKELQQADSPEGKWKRAEMNLKSLHLSITSCIKELDSIVIDNRPKKIEPFENDAILVESKAEADPISFPDEKQGKIAAATLENVQTQIATEHPESLKQSSDEAKVSSFEISSAIRHSRRKKLDDLLK